MQHDCYNLMINPLIWTKSNQFRAASPFIEIDENSLYRQSEMLALHDNAQINKLERVASLNGLRYGKLNESAGNIGLITNGHSLATMDMVDLCHGKPANWLDLHGSSSIEDMLYAIDLMQFDSRVKVVFINIFGGDLDISPISEGIATARDYKIIKKPIVARVRGIFEKEVNDKLSAYLAQC